MNALVQSAASPAMPPLLRTLLLSDLVDSTGLIQRLGDQHAAQVLRRHDRMMRTALQEHGGREIDKTDGFLAMFERPVQAVAFALDYQRALRQLAADEGVALAARIGIHVGDVVAWDNTPEDISRGAKPVEVEGLVKPITSRLMQLALPQQILLSGVAHSLAHRAQGELGSRLPAVRWRTHGRYRFKGVPDPIPVFEVGAEGIAPLRAPPWSGKAHREVPFWRRPASLGLELGLLLAALAVPAWYLLKPEPAIAFAQRDWVVLGDLKNLTDQPAFDDAAQTAFRIGLEQSRYVNVLSDLKTRETLALMQRDPDRTSVDRSVGSEVAIRDGARALILPTVAEIGGRVRVTAEVVDPATQTTVWSESADGAGSASVLPSLDQVNQKLRVRLGEALATVSHESRPLDRVATSNLEALRAYSLGQHACSVGNCREGIGLLRQAVKLDPDFALAHAAIAAADNDIGDNAGALREIGQAIAGKDRLSPRDALYVDAWRALFDAPRPALEKWRTLARLYPDFFPAQGVYGYFAWQYANRYDDALASYAGAESPRNPHPQLREYVRGVLYLGQEEYTRAGEHFRRARELGLASTNFAPAVDAAQRHYDRLDAELARSEPPAASATDVSSANLRLAYAVDRSRWDDVRKLLATARTQAGGGTRGQRKLDGIETSLSFPGALGVAEAERARHFLDGEIAALDGETGIDRAETLFHVLFAGYLAASRGDAAGAELALAHAGSESRSGDYPVPGRMLAALEAEIARAQGKPEEAVGILLRQPLDGSELCLTHVALMNAYADLGRNAAAIEQARWIATRRGRAYTEYNADWIARPFNVAQSDLALLRLAELTLASGDKDAARGWLKAFRAAWTSGATGLSARAAKLDASL